MKTYIRSMMLSAILIFSQILYAQDNRNEFNKYGWIPANTLIELADSLPSDFPKITIDTLNNPAPGYIFMESLGISKSIFYLLVLDSAGNTFYYKKPSIAGIDFKPEPNGLFSYASPVQIGSGTQSGPLNIQNFNVINYILDSTFTIIDSVQMQNGYLADFHEFRILPNGHYLLISYDNNYIDMSKIVNGGNPNAKVIGTVIQELDNNKNCVFQWRSLDHYPVTDSRDNLKNATFEHAHVSSLYLDTDGNLIISLVATAEIIKIDMTSGKIIWRLGGLNNQFNITGEHEENAPDYFSMQHDVQRLDNGNLLFYDNGPYKKPWYSRAAEYTLDESNKTASLTWEYRHSPDLTGFAMGSAQRLKNGNTLISWGLIFGGLFRTVTEVTPDNNISFELSLPSDAFTYRAAKYELPLCKPIADVYKYDVQSGNEYIFDNEEEQSGIEIYFESLNGFLYNIFNVNKYNCPPVNVSFNGEAPVLMPCRFVTRTQNIDSFYSEIKFDFSKLPPRYNASDLKVYFRQKEGEGVFSELATIYDLGENNLVVNSSSTGEFVIGFMRNENEIFPPSLISPYDKQSLINNQPVSLVWSPTGRYNKFQLQVSEDSLFTNNIIDSSELKIPNFSESTEPDKTYYWRVKTYYENLESEWSDVHSFNCTSPFISMELPNGGETFYIDTTSNIIRWKTNLADTMSVTLYKNGVKHADIVNKLISYTNSFDWKIPKTTPIDSNYRIKITSLKDSTFFTESKSDFTIKLLPTSVEDLLENGDAMMVSNYPNPTNNSINFKFIHDLNEKIKIKIFDLFGKETPVEYNGELPPGENTIELEATKLNNGNYIYQLNSGTKSFFGKITIIK
ncbi:MAG: aryl-sulfate sulfotransferase [Ignavibacteriae bacterium]|nr:aryl-sulfate sulfotransferase [Ignavibacteriota bacterium]